VAHSRIVTVPLYFDFQPRKATWTLVDCAGVPLLNCDELKPLRIGARNRDAWEMRDRFFHLRRGNVHALLDFLNEWGPWAEHYGEPEIRFTWDANPRDTAQFAPDAIWDRQEWFRRALLNPFEWFARGENQLKPTECAPADFPHWGMMSTSVEYAIRLTISIDLLNRTRFRVCKRKDCRAPYPVESDHERKYCSQYCGHLESIRGQRKKAKKPKGERHAKG
jgi:hypothetical protein